MTFEQELYNNFSLYLSKPYFMTFAGDVSRRSCSCDCVSVPVLNVAGEASARSAAARPRPSHRSSSFSLVHSQTCQVGLNFASEEETKRFRSHVTELLDRRQRKSGTC